MYEFFYQKKSALSRKLICSFVALTFSMGLVLGPTSIVQAQYVSNLPQPGTMVLLSPAFAPPVLKGMTLHPENPLHFDFIVDRGQDKLSGDALKNETQKLLKYFLAAMTIPDDDSWVNLSPYEGDRIIPDMLGSTDMGKQMLEQDYLLKQLSASLTNPQEEIGKKFWDTVYKKAYEKFGTTAVPINTFNKVWIVPDRALILEEDGYVFIGETHLKVMLDEDYASIKANLKSEKFGTKNIAQDKVEALNNVSSEVVRQVILPELEKEINEGKNFTAVRQIYNSVILAAWYKQNLKNSLLGRVYVDKSKIAGVDIAEKDLKQKVYEQYLAAFRKGVYNLIKEDYDLSTKETLPRKYFSGGFDWKATANAIRVPTSVSEKNKITRGIEQAIDEGSFTSISTRMTEGKEAPTVTALAAVASAPLTGNAGQSAAAGDFQRRLTDKKDTTKISPETIISEILPENLKKLAALGVPQDSIDYWAGHYVEALRRENPEAYELWRANHQNVLSRTFDAPISNFKQGLRKNATFSSAFPDGMTINGVSLELPAKVFMSEEYRQAAASADYYRSDANAGYGESLKRQQNLLELIKTGLIPNRARDLGGLPKLLAKSMDTFVPITLSSGKTHLISIFELRVLRVIQLAYKGTYKSVSLQQLVNEQSKDIVGLFLTNKFPDFAYELIGLSQDRIAELQEKNVDNYQQLFQELGVSILDVDEYQGLPTVNPQTWEVEAGETANAGHGLVAYRKLHELLNQGKKLLADQRAGKSIPDLSNVVYEYDNGDGPNNEAPVELVGYVVKNGIGMALLGVTREMVDIKVGLSYRLMGKDSNGQPTELLEGAEIAGFKDDPEALSLFLASGRTPETAGNQWANTNTLLISGKMALFLAELAEIVGEDVLFKAMMPSLLLSKKNGVLRLEGAMITTVFNTFNFVNTSKDPKVLALMKKHGFDAQHPLLTLPSLPSEMRSSHFTPIKFIGDMLGMEVALSAAEKFGAVDQDLKVRFAYPLGLVNFDSDGTFAKRTGVSSYSDLAEARALIGTSGDWSKMDTFTVLGRVKMLNSTLIGNVHIENYSDSVFDVEQWIRTKAAMTALSVVSPDGVRLSPEGQSQLENVMIVVNKSGQVSFSPYSAKWAELSLEARKLLSFLQMTYKDQPIEISLQEGVVENLLKQAGMNMDIMKESDYEKVALSLLAELGIKKHEKDVVADGQRATADVYSFMIEDSGRVAPATAQQLQDRIMSASSAILGEDVPSAASSAVGQALTPAEIVTYSAGENQWDFVKASEVYGSELVRDSEQELTTDYQINFFERQTQLRGAILALIFEYSQGQTLDFNELKDRLDKIHTASIDGYGGQSGLTITTAGYHSKANVDTYIELMDRGIKNFVSDEFQSKSLEEKINYIAEFQVQLAQRENIFSAANYSYHMAWINAMLRLSGLTGIAHQDWDKQLRWARDGVGRERKTLEQASGDVNQEVLAAIKEANPEAFGNKIAAGTNAAQVQAGANVAASPVGGIDFDPSLLNLQIKRNGKGVPLPLPQQNLENINIDGLYPVIINMQPATIQNFPFLLSKVSTEKEPELAVR